MQVISALGDEGRIDQAVSLLAEMRAEGHTPNGMTYNGIILDACHEGCLKDAVQLMSSMEKDGMQPLPEAVEAMRELAVELGNAEVEADCAAKAELLRASRAKIEATPVSEVSEVGRNPGA